MTDAPQLPLAVRPMTLEALPVWVIVAYPDDERQKPFAMNNGKLAVYNNQPAAARGLAWVIRNVTATLQDGTELELTRADAAPERKPAPLRLITKGSAGREPAPAEHNQPRTRTHRQARVPHQL